MHRGNAFLFGHPSKYLTMDTQERINAIKQFPFFNALGQEVIEGLAVESKVIVKPKYHYIYVPGDQSKEVFFLLEGSIKIGVYSDEYKESVRDVLHPLALFGELSLMGEENREGFALTMVDNTKLLALDAEVMLQAMIHNLQLHMLIMKAFGRRLRIAEHRAEDLIHKDARTRIVEFLKNTVLQRGRKVGYEFYLKHGLTQQDIASITGTSRQTVTLVLNELKKANCIHFTRNSILVRDILKLDTYVS